MEEMKDLFVQTSNRLDILGERIKDNITSYYPDLVPDAVRVRGQSYGSTGTANTFRFWITSTGHKRRHCIFVKFSPVAPTMNWGRTEYESLRFLYSRMPSIDSRCSVARPLDYYDDMEALLIDKVEGIPFKNFFLRQNSRVRKELPSLHIAVSDCGRWLKTFHGLTHHGEQPFCLDSFVQSLRRELDMFPDYKLAQDLRKMIMVLLDHLRPIDQIPLPAASWHYDFTPGHVFITANGVSVIDIHGRPGAFIYEDIGHWLASMATVNAFPRYPFFDYVNANGPLGRVFLDAYFSENNLKAKASFMLSYLFKLRYLIQMFSEQYQRVSLMVHPMAAAVFNRLRLVKLFRRQILEVIRTISMESNVSGI